MNLRNLCSVILLFCLVACGIAQAQEPNGAFNISPVGSPVMNLEAVGGGTVEGTLVSIGVPSAAASQKWVFIPKGNNYYVIRPSYSANLALAVESGRTENGTQVILENESGKPSQLWSFKRNSNGTISILAKHAPDKGLDDFGGSKEAGAKQDLWDYNSDDEHLQWVIKPLNGAKLPVAEVPTANAPAAVANASQQITGNPVPSEIPAGVVKEFTFNESKIYPGTVRSGAVFIPAQYDGKQPACVYVQQDGYRREQKTMLEALIAAKDMPVTIGVFIRPGDLPSPDRSMPARRNRCFEYDGVGDNNVRFLTEELLPYIEKTFDVKLSKEGKDRCTAGASSGGISAFNTAWERPDAFSRVYANSGSFVAFRAGHELPTLIRKTEAKPIRVYFTTATHDMENCAGDWYLLDQEMDKAMKFSGYNYVFKTMEGGHCTGWNENFPDAMRFIWQGWPEPVKPGTSAPRVRDVILDGQSWEVAAEGYRDARSPACNSKGEVFFIDTKANKICRIGLDGKVTPFVNHAAGANGLTVGSKDEIYTVSKSTGNVMRYDTDGKGTVYAKGVNGLYILARPQGGVYVSAENKDGNGSQILLVKDGQKTTTETDIKLATGMAMRPDQWLLSVADGRSKWVHSFQMNTDGSLANHERFFWLHVSDWEDDTGAESVCFAKEGQMFVATRMGLQICADDGPTQSILPMPDRSRVFGVCLGGPEMSTLYAFAGDKVWKRVVKVHATGAFEPATKIKYTPL